MHLLKTECDSSKVARPLHFKYIVSTRFQVRSGEYQNEAGPRALLRLLLLGDSKTSSGRQSCPEGLVC